MGVAAAAAQALRENSDRFKPALAGEGASTWTLRHALLAACGCDRRAGPMAYWEWEQLTAALHEVRPVIAHYAGIPQGMDAERWANQRFHSLEDVLGALDAVPAASDVPVPDQPELRPWCDPKVIVTCRIPYVPLAALVHAWGGGRRPWAELAGEFDLEAGTTAWELLRRVDPMIRATPPAEGVRQAAERLRTWMDLEPLSTAPVAWLFAVTEDDADLVALVDKAESVINARRKDSAKAESDADE